MGKRLELLVSFKKVKAPAWALLLAFAVALAVPAVAGDAASEMELTDGYRYWLVMDEKWSTSEAPPGSIFIVVHVKIENLSDTESYNVGTLRMRGGDANENVPPTYYMGESPLETNLLLPAGEEIEGNVKFVAPEGSTGYHVRFRFAEEPDVWALWVAE